MELLKRLAVDSGCEYISDLHIVRKNELRERLLSLSAADYPLKEWLDAENYILGTKPACFGSGTLSIRHEYPVTSEGIRRRIICRLEEDGQKIIRIQGCR